MRYVTPDARQIALAFGSLPRSSLNAQSGFLTIAVSLVQLPVCGLRPATRRQALSLPSRCPLWLRLRLRLQLQLQLQLQLRLQLRPLQLQRVAWTRRRSARLWQCCIASSTHKSCQKLTG